MLTINTAIISNIQTLLLGADYLKQVISTDLIMVELYLVLCKMTIPLFIDSPCETLYVQHIATKGSEEKSDYQTTSLDTCTCTNIQATHSRLIKNSYFNSQNMSETVVDHD